MKPWFIGVLLLCSTVAAAQMPPCFRSKYAAEWPIKVKRVELQDGNKLSGHDKSTISRELKRQCDCWPCALSDEVSQQIRDMYQWYGYFQAVADVDIHRLGVDSYAIRAHVQEGPQYRLKDIEIAGARAFPATQLRPLFALQPGDLFDTRKVREGVERLRQLYSTRGYLNFSPVPNPSVDTAAGTITLRIDLDEGPVFRLGPLVLSGLEPQRGFGKKLMDQWRPHVGEVYNSEFVDGFVNQNLTGLDGRPPHVMYIQDAKAGTVTVRVEFQTFETRMP